MILKSFLDHDPKLSKAENQRELLVSLDTSISSEISSSDLLLSVDSNKKYKTSRVIKNNRIKKIQKNQVHRSKFGTYYLKWCIL